MSKIKTITSAVTAVVLVSGIGLAVAQSKEQPAQPATMTQATDQAQADPNAMPADTTAQQPADPSQQQTTPPPADPMTQNSTPLPADQTTTPAVQDSTIPASTEPAPRADRN